MNCQLDEVFGKLSNTRVDAFLDNFTFQITPKNKKYIEKNTMAPKSEDKNKNKLEPKSAFILSNKVRHFYTKCL